MSETQHTTIEQAIDKSPILSFVLRDEQGDILRASEFLKDFNSRREQRFGTEERTITDKNLAFVFEEMGLFRADVEEQAKMNVPDILIGIGFELGDYQEIKSVVGDLAEKMIAFRWIKPEAQEEVPKEVYQRLITACLNIGVRYRKVIDAKLGPSVIEGSVD